MRCAGPRLVILNTVQSAAVVARAMRDAGHDTLHLSTALAPKDRAPILKRVEEKLKEDVTDWTMVATSCVEAGVDLSFRTAFRERFSTASLIQVGGRVNRHGEKAEGIVFDFCIDEGDGITRHPGARYSAAVLKRQLEAEPDCCRAKGMTQPRLSPARWQRKSETAAVSATTRSRKQSAIAIIPAWQRRAA